MRRKCHGRAGPGEAGSPERRALLRSSAALVALSAVGPLARRADARALTLGAQAPPATLITLDGQHVSTATLVGRVVILTFWATYCVPCRDELPLLSRFAIENSAGLSVLGFCLDEPQKIDEVRRIANSLSFPVGFLREDSAPGYGRIWRLPANFTIGRDGRLRDDRWRDKNPAWTAETLQQVIVPLLG
jgi:cytochrome c biogenesis protein CcmG, thiol:disulfide interchange protein DsbE